MRTHDHEQALFIVLDVLTLRDILGLPFFAGAHGLTLQMHACMPLDKPKVLCGSESPAWAYTFSSSSQELMLAGKLVNICVRLYRDYLK